MSKSRGDCIRDVFTDEIAVVAFPLTKVLPDEIFESAMREITEAAG